MAKAPLARRQSSDVVMAREEARRLRVEALGFSGREAQVLAELGEIARSIAADPGAKGADRLRAVEWLVSQLGPAQGGSSSTGESGGERGPLVNLTLVAPPTVRPADVVEADPAEG